MSIGDIIKNCEYARIATHTDLNPINWGDAEGFFMEGMEYQRRLQESQLAVNANMVMVNDHRHDQLLAAEARVAEYERILKDPASVWANMLTGKIARPQVLAHYEECKSMVEKLEEQVRVLRNELSVISHLHPGPGEMTPMADATFKLEAHQDGAGEAPRVVLDAVVGQFGRMEGAESPHEPKPGSAETPCRAISSTGLGAEWEWDAKEKPCRTCKQTGKSPLGLPCWRCNGSGKYQIAVLRAVRVLPNVRHERSDAKRRSSPSDCSRL